jgi:TonB family protein
MTSKVSLIFADRGAPIELTGDVEIRRAIETGLLSKDTWITFVDGNESGKVRAIDAPGVADLFIAPPAHPPEERTTEPSPPPEPVLDPEEPAAPVGQTESAPSAPQEIDQFSEATPGPATPTYDRRGASGGTGVAVIAVVGVVAVIALVAVISNGDKQASSVNPGYPSATYDQGAPSAVDTRPVERHYAARVVSVRGSASRDGAIIGEAPRGETFDGVLTANAEGEQWVEIRGGRWDGGYVWLGNLRDIPRPQLTPLPIQLMASYVTEVFKEPSTSSGYLGAQALQAGSRVDALGYTADGWTEITVEGSGVGYVQSAALERWEDLSGIDEGQNDGTIDGDGCTNSTSVKCGPATAPPSPPPSLGASGPRPDVTSPGAKPIVLANPVWGRQVLPEYPERAAAQGYDQIATVRVSCSLEPSGSLSDCRTVSEEPTGMGFGAAALAAARRSRVTPGTVNGAAVGARVEYNIRFRPPPPE